MNQLSLRNNQLKFKPSGTDHFRGSYRIYYPNLIKENRRMWTWNRLDMQTLGSLSVIMPKNLPDHCSKLMGTSQWFGITGWDPSFCKSNRGYMLTSSKFPFLNWGILYSINSSKTVGDFPAVSNFNRLFLNSTGSFVTNCWFSPIIGTSPEALVNSDQSFLRTPPVHL